MGNVVGTIPPRGRPGPTYADEINAALAALDGAQPFAVTSRGGAADNGTTDNGIAANQCIVDMNTAGGILYYPKPAVDAAYDHATPIDCLHKTVVIMGSGGFSGGSATGSRITYSGPDGRFVDARDTAGFGWHDLWCTVTRSAFVGTVIDLSYVAGAGLFATSGFHIEHIFLSAPANAGVVLIDLDGSIDGHIEGPGNLVGGDIAIRGQNTTTNATNGHTITGHIRMSGQATAAIYNAGQAWTITAVFEGGADHQPRAYKSNKYAYGVTFLDCYAGDSTGTGTLIDWLGAGLKIDGGWLDSGVSTYASTCVQLQAGSEGARFTGVGFGDWNVVFYSYSATGISIDESCTFRHCFYVIGSGAIGADSRICDKALPALANANVTIGAGFGSTASVFSIVGTDNGFLVVIQAGGVTLGAADFTSNIKVTFKKTWAGVREVAVTKSSSFAVPDINVGHAAVVTATDVTIYWTGIPTNGRFYGFHVRLFPGPPPLYAQN